MEKLFILSCLLAFVATKPQFRFGTRYGNQMLYNNYIPDSVVSITPSPYKTFTRVLGTNGRRNQVPAFFNTTPRPQLVQVNTARRPLNQPPRIIGTIYNPTIDSGFGNPPFFGITGPNFGSGSGTTVSPPINIVPIDQQPGNQIPVDFNNPGSGGITTVDTSIFEASDDEPVVTKHFYIHSAPDEPDDVVHKHLTIGKPQKAYRVVFIKAPASNAQAHITASFAPKDEKTVIYVLSKKPNEVEINDIVTPPPTEPSKPEVIFVKYKTKEEALHAQQTIQAQYDQLGGSSQVSDEGIAPITSVIGALGSSASSGNVHREFRSDDEIIEASPVPNLSGIHPLNQQYKVLAEKNRD